MIFSPQLYFSDPFLPHWEPQRCYTRWREKTVFEVIISIAKTWHYPGDKKNQKYWLAKCPLYPYWSCSWANFTESQKKSYQNFIRPQVEAFFWNFSSSTRLLMLFFMSLFTIFLPSSYVHFFSQLTSFSAFIVFENHFFYFFISRSYRKQ